MRAPSFHLVRPLVAVCAFYGPLVLIKDKVAVCIMDCITRYWRLYEQAHIAVTVAVYGCMIQLYTKNFNHHFAAYKLAYSLGK